MIAVNWENGAFPATLSESHIIYDDQQRFDYNTNGAHTITEIDFWDLQRLLILTDNLPVLRV